jgi:MFS family permease|tara:strand:- start:293 stop:1456 length:1164 start_codon:yes stop_codon:yes gene_type:complete
VKLLKSKFAVCFFFFSGGASLALWAVHIPLIERTVGIGYVTLGALFMFSGLGGFAAMQLYGWIIDHIGAKTATRIGGLVVGLSLLGPALAQDVWSLGLAIFFLGFGIAGVDVGMNAAALQVDKVNKRAIFTFFHLFWSVGGLFGAALGFATISAGFDQSQTLSITGVVLSVTGVIVAGWLLPNEVVATKEDKNKNRVASKANRRVLPLVILAGLMASAGAIIEGVAQDWSALYLIDIQNVGVAAAAWGLVAFNLGMITGRIFIDRIVENKGRGFIIRWGSLLGGVAIAAQAIAPTFEISLVLWYFLGLGISGVVPQIFAAGGEIGEATHSGRNMARVVGITYVGALAGPSAIGLLTAIYPLNVAIGWGTALAIFILVANPRLEKLTK